VEFLVNDLSINGQFPDLSTFLCSISRVMSMRDKARRFGRELHCHRNIVHSQVTRDISMQQAIQALDRNQRQSVIPWFTKLGPFWEDERSHGPDDYLECNGDVVTDTAVGEAAWNSLNGIERRLVSFTPSNWEFSPVHVDFVADNSVRKSVEVENHWDPASFEDILRAAPAPLTSWGQIGALATVRYTQLTFATNAFTPLNGHPFVSGAAQRILFILDTLNRFKSCFDADGQRTSAGHEIYHNFFTGKKEGGGRGALFTDSSDSEKADFEAKMTFIHPADATKTLTCTWHGKVQTPQLRVHFSYPVRAEDPLYVVYVGPKLTKY